MRYDKLFIDISNFYFRGFSIGEKVSKTFSDGTAVLTNGIVDTFRMLKRVERDFLKMKGEVYFLFDNSHSGITKRRQIDPDYKKTRTLQEESFYRSLDFLHLILMNYQENYKVVKVEGFEADDLVHTLVKQFPEDNILLISNDLDWFRAISSKVKVAKYEDKDYKIYGIPEFEERFGFNPSIENLCIYKSFRGDKSDNIPKGVERIRTKDLVNLIENFSSLPEILYDVDSIDFISENLKEKIKEAIPRLLINYKLVDFLDVDETELLENIFDCKFNPNVLHSLYKTLGLEIKTFDPRVYQFFPEDKSFGEFFKMEKIPRA